jgi:hypothetical protein
MQISKTAREAAARTPVELPVTVDEDKALEEVAGVVADAGRLAVDAEIVIEPEIKPPPTEEFKSAMEVMKELVSGFYETVQAKVEWEAKLEIAEVEANAKRVEAIMESVGRSATGAADVLGSVFGAVGELRETGFDRYDIRKWIAEQVDIQRRALGLQETMAETEKRYMDARTRAFERGDPLITISGDGLQPHLEGFMWEILGAVQTRITEEGVDMLLGVT